jgi:probable rRNA maturation factor
MGTIEVVVRHAAGRPHAARCAALLGRLRRVLRRPRHGVVLLLATDATVRRLNRTHRGLDRVTDVLSFPAEGELEPGRPHLGEIAIAVPQAARQARRAGWPARAEMSLLVVHGFLHLLGYDHETDDGTMRRLEARLLQRTAGVALARRRLPWGEAEAARGARPGRRPGRTA